MSLDVHLTMKGEPKKYEQARIFIREDGQTRELSREEWAERFPGQEPATVDLPESEEVYWANITHNLNKMAAAAGIYEPLWRPDEIGITKARELIEPLASGIEKLKSDPEHFKQFNAPNGWGLYEHFVPFVEKYLEACRSYPDADVYASR